MKELAVVAGIAEEEASGIFVWEVLGVRLPST